MRNINLRGLRRTSAATRCCEELGAQTRYQAYFRLYRRDRPEGKQGTYPEALLDTWLEFEGMRQVVQDLEGKQPGKTADINPRL